MRHCFHFTFKKLISHFLWGEQNKKGIKYSRNLAYFSKKFKACLLFKVKQKAKNGLAKHVKKVSKKKKPAPKILPLQTFEFWRQKRIALCSMQKLKIFWSKIRFFFKWCSTTVTCFHFVFMRWILGRILLPPSFNTQYSFLYCMHHGVGQHDIG